MIFAIFRLIYFATLFDTLGSANLQCTLLIMNVQSVSSHVVFTNFAQEILLPKKLFETHDIVSSLWRKTDCSHEATKWKNNNFDSRPSLKAAAEVGGEGEGGQKKFSRYYKNGYGWIIARLGIETDRLVGALCLSLSITPPRTQAISLSS